jgi:hypothetical protein
MHAASILTIPQEELNPYQRNQLRTLAASLHDLGQIRRELYQPECIDSYEESLRLAERISDRNVAAACAFNLGNSYIKIPALRDLEQAERWFQHSLEKYEDNQKLDRAQCLSQLGHVALERFLEARNAEQPDEDLLRHLNSEILHPGT